MHEHRRKQSSSLSSYVIICWHLFLRWLTTSKWMMKKKMLQHSCNRASLYTCRCQALVVDSPLQTEWREEKMLQHSCNRAYIPVDAKPLSLTPHSILAALCEHFFLKKGKDLAEPPPLYSTVGESERARARERESDRDRGVFFLNKKEETSRSPHAIFDASSLTWGR